MTKWLVKLVGLGLAAIVSGGLLIGHAHADTTLQSAHYHFDESTLGDSGLIQSSSPNFQSTEAVGSAAVGNSSSSNFQTESGSLTTANPALTFTVDTGTAGFGTFSSTSAVTATSTFSVSDYTSYGYIVEIVGNAPSNDGHTITGMSSNDISRPGINQFGINLVANTSPTTFGANPNHGQFGVGSPAPNYATPNSFRYVSGETIAVGPKSSGITTYTISYLVNIASLMPGGQYTSNLALVCIATF